MASAGDVNGDGFDDLIVGAIGADPHGSRFGRELCGVRQGVGICRQSRPVEPRRQQWLQAQRRGGGRLQRLLGGLGGRCQRRRLRRPDRRRSHADPHGTLSGRELCGVRQGSGFAANLDLSSLDGSNGFKLSGVAAYDSSGRSVASAGDVNGDGFDDLIVGAIVADPHGSYSGASYVVFGKATGFAANLDLSTPRRQQRLQAQRRGGDDLAAARSRRRAMSMATASTT